MKRKPKPRIDEHKLAVEIAKWEGKNVSLSIGQVKEVLCIVLELLALEKPSEVLDLLEYHQ